MRDFGSLLGIDGIAGGRVGGTHISHGSGVGGAAGFHNRIEGNGEGRMGGIVRIQRYDPGPVSPIQFFQVNMGAAGNGIPLFVHGEGSGKTENHLIPIQSQHIAVFFLHQTHAGRVNMEFNGANRLQVLEYQGILETVRLDAGEQVYTGQQFLILHGAFQMDLFVLTGNNALFFRFDLLRANGCGVR